jgi:hypothetical protein
VRAGLQHATNGVDLDVRNGDGLIGKADNPDNARNGQNGKAVMRIEPGKYVAREQRRVYFTNPVRPSALGGVKRKEFLESSVLDRYRGYLLAVGLHPYRIPGVLGLLPRRQLSEVLQADPMITVPLRDVNATLRSRRRYEYRRGTQECVRHKTHYGLTKKSRAAGLTFRSTRPLVDWTASCFDAQPSEILGRCPVIL